MTDDLLNLTAVRKRAELLRRHGKALDETWLHVAAKDMDDLAAEVERLRAVAWQLHSAMTDQHEEAAHILNDDCEPCQKAADEMDSQYCCDDYKRRQKAYVDALGLVIGEKS